MTGRKVSVSPVRAVAKSQKLRYNEGIPNAIVPLGTKKEAKMIKDNVRNSALYEGINPGFPIAFAFIKEVIASPKEVGRYDLEKGVFAFVQSYDSKPAENCKIEAHKKYIDIQFVLKGKELFGVADLATQALYEDRFEEKDVAFYHGEVDLLTLSDGDFVIVFPEDAHRPQQGDGSHVEKIVVKVPVL